MRANCWYGKNDLRVEEVPDPQILNGRDAIVKVSSTAICGSDLHLYNGFMPTMEKGDILGHEFMGEVVEVGPDVRNLKVGERVDGREDVRPQPVRHLRLLAPDGRLRRGAGRVRARTLRRRGHDQSPRR